MSASQGSNGDDEWQPTQDEKRQEKLDEEEDDDEDDNDDEIEEEKLALAQVPAVVTRGKREAEEEESQLPSPPMSEPVSPSKPVGPPAQPGDIMQANLAMFAEMAKSFFSQSSPLTMNDPAKVCRTSYHRRTSSFFTHTHTHRLQHASFSFAGG